MKTYFPQVLNARVDEKDKKSAIFLDLLIPSSLIYFQGHFEEMPVLPGIAQLDFVIHYAQQYLFIEKSWVESIKQMKFTSLIKPEMVLKLEINLNHETLEFRYFSLENNYSSGSIALKKKRTKEDEYEFRP